MIGIRTPRFRPARQRGASLLEVLIAVLILAIGMLGMAALQAVTLKNSNSSAARSQAAMQTYSLLDTLRLDRAGALAGSYNVPGWTCSAGTNDPDDPDDTTDYSVFNTWLAGLDDAVGADACGRLVCAASGTCTVGLRWSDERATGGAAEPLEFETTSGL
ncbi:MAG: type IV pilus modification protein PilV [Xanthomonadales bacterium]|nr:type IV pilus modification protein PilV [Xanthomonadales bacterium]